MMGNHSNVSELTFKYSVFQLLEKLKANREAHIEAHKKAMAGYEKELAERLIAISTYAQECATAIQTKHVAKIDQRKLSIHDLDKPQEYTKQYDEAIEMLEMTIEEEIELPQLYFRQLVCDEWDWKREFQTYSAKYTG